MVEPLVLPIKIRNARDLGSYTGIDGRKIKKHRLLRTGKLYGMSEYDKAYLKNYGLKTIIDFRTAEERKYMPDPKIEGVKHLDIAVHEDEKVGAPDQTREQLKKTYDKDQYAGFKVMCHQYRKTVKSTHSQEAYHRFFESLASQEEGATIFHCSEGKDRTGFAAVYLLHILGVDPQIIRADYLYSNFTLTNYRNQLDDKAVSEGANEIMRASLRSLASVANEYLDTALILINKDYGNLDNYLKENIGIDQAMISRLRELYLEPEKA